ncbi:hypothetical protein BZA77DRAFT_245567, partial [Pyronema omphalodes]
MISQTVAAWISVLGVAFALVPLLQERIVRIKNRNAGRMSSDPEKMSFFYVTPPSNLKALFGECTKEPRLTTIRGLIHAGDQYLWTSAALDHVKISRGEICWVPLYRSVFNTVAANRFNGSDNVSEVKAFLERAWNHLNDEKIKHSISLLQFNPNPKLVCCTRKLRPPERVTFNPIPANSNQYDEVTIRRNESGLNDTRACWILDGKPCIELCREELAALALALGMKLRVNDFTSIVSGFGAFSTSLGIQRSGGYWKAHLVHGSRIPSQKNSQGSGYTILMAKHIACGCLPFTDTGVFVRTVYVTKNVLRALTRGHHIMDCTDYGGPSLEYLRRLPSAKQIDALYGMSKKPADLKAAKKPVAQSTFLALGALLNADGNPIGSNCTWQRAVAGIAFGGLVPQAATYLTEA